MKDSEILEAIQSKTITGSNQSMNAWLLLGLSLFAFIGMGAFQWDLEFAFLLMVAIFIHELGHLLAMKLYRYKNLKMLFIPLIGGAASGESEEQNAYKIAMISIYGSFIGFLSCIGSVVLWAIFKEELLIEYAYLSLFINTINLLPIVPLDGGHFLNETLFNRFPKAEFGFKIFAIICLSLLSYYFELWIFAFFALFMFLPAFLT